MFTHVKKTGESLKKYLQIIVQVLVHLFNHPLNKKKPVVALIRLVVWQIYKRLIAKPIITQLLNGSKFVLRPDCVISSSIIYVEIPDFNEIDFIRSKLNDKSVLFDIGANVGSFSLFFSDIVSTVYAFEPAPQTFQRLEENFFLNRPQKLNAYKFGMSDKIGRSFFIDQGGSSTTNRIVDLKTCPACIEITLDTIDNFCNVNRIMQIDCIKIDVEGYEIKVLRGGTRSIGLYRPKFIMFEILTGSLLGEFRKYFEELDYFLYAISKSGITILENDFIGHQNLIASPIEIKPTLIL